MPISSKDLDLIEKIVDRSNSDLAVAMARTLESLEAKIDAVGKSLHLELLALAEKTTISRANKNRKDNDTDSGEKDGQKA